MAEAFVRITLTFLFRRLALSAFRRAMSRGYSGGPGEGSADAHHAWAEAWVAGLGWVGFDVANRICPTERYVRLACGLDAGYAAPITGSRKGGADEKLDVAVEVQQQSAQQ